MKALLLSLLALCGLFVSGLRRQFSTANVEGSAGTHKTFTRRSDGAFTDTHLLVKVGSDAGHVTMAGAADYPLGSTTDNPSEAEDIINVHPLGSAEHSRKLRCATALGQDIDLYTAAGGFVQGEPGSAGTYYRVGRSVNAAVQVGSSDYIIEVATQAPVKLTVAATPSTVANIAAALTTGPGLVKFL